MKVLVVSDNHGDRDILVQLLEAYQGKVDGFFHCGDSELPYSDTLFQQYVGVGGNMDFDVDYPQSATKTIDNVTCFIAHGHRLGVNFHLDGLLESAQQNHADCAFYGHTHQLLAEVKSGVLIVNPGSISQPRGQYASIGGTYCIVEVSKAFFEVTYYDRQMQAVPDLGFRFNR